MNYLQSPKLTHEKHLANQIPQTCMPSATRMCYGWRHEKKGGQRKSIQQFIGASGRIHKYCRDCRGVK